MNQTSNRKGIGCALLFLIVFASIGLFILGIFAKYSYQIIQSKNWIETPATIQFIDYEMDYSSSSRGGSTKIYEVIIKYQYEFEGKTYQGNQISVGYGKNNTEEHLMIHWKLKKAAKIKVFINPEAPEEALMIKGFSNTVIFYLIFGLIWSITAAVFLFFLFKKAPSQFLLKTALFGLFAVWGTGLLIMNETHIPIEDKIEILETKKNEEIEASENFEEFEEE